MSSIIHCPVCTHACGNLVDAERGITIHCQYCGYDIVDDAAHRIKLGFRFNPEYDEADVVCEIRALMKGSR